MASSSEGYLEARCSSLMPCNAAHRREPSIVICWEYEYRLQRLRLVR
ncbi:MAG: hypothetical protein ACLSG8_08020 [Barnesiella sp.]